MYKVSYRGTLHAGSDNYRGLGKQAGKQAGREADGRMGIKEGRNKDKIKKGKRNEGRKNKNKLFYSFAYAAGREKGRQVGR
jgi:hypothetical protein